MLEREISNVPLERAAAKIILQCCIGRSVRPLTAKGIVHRDMKPENIFLIERDGRPRVRQDRGLRHREDERHRDARGAGSEAHQDGDDLRNPEYMSPEQAAGKPLDHRVDVYALAVILYEMLTGRVPFVGDTFMGILTQHMFEAPPAMHDVNPRIDVPDSIMGFVNRGLAKDPEQRFQTCEEMGEALREALAGRTVGSSSYASYASASSLPPSGSQFTETTSITEVTQSPSRSIQLGVAAGLAILLFISLGAGGRVLSDATDRD